MRDTFDFGERRRRGIACFLFQWIPLSPFERFERPKLLESFGTTFRRDNCLFLTLSSDLNPLASLLFMYRKVLHVNLNILKYKIWIYLSCLWKHHIYKKIVLSSDSGGFRETPCTLLWPVSNIFRNLVRIHTMFDSLNDFNFIEG